jgi:sec-independent protein translocase protein TatC
MLPNLTSLVWHYLFQEFKNRAGYSLLSFLMTLGVIVFFGTEYFFMWTSPFISLESARPRAFLCMDLTEPMTIQLWVYLFTTTLTLVPYSIYQFFAFAGPSLYKKDWDERVNQMMAFVFSLYIAWGVSYLYFFPKMCAFFFNFEQKEAFIPIILEPRISSLLSFLINALAYELLFFMLFFSFLNLIRYKQINIYPYRRIVAFFNLFFTALLSPPDLLTQGVLFSFFLICYEILLIYGLYIKKRKSYRI